MSALVIVTVTVYRNYSVGVFYDSEGIKVLSDIPSREVLLAKFLGSIQSPVSKAVRTFQAIADAKAAE